MAENILAEFLRPVTAATVKWVGATIIRQFNYLFCFTSNIATLKDEAQALENRAGDLQDRVDSARDNAQVIAPEVETWLTKSNHMKDLKKTILVEVPNVESGCLKLKARFSLSKRAKKTADDMKKLRDRGKFDVISQPGPLAAMEAVPLGTTFDFNSRKQIEEDIMKSLRDGEMNMIGICGMGGLGKTTMAKIIMNRSLKDQLFDEVVMAVVSQPVDKLKIQLEIGGALGLKDLKEETSEASRVQKLHARLTAGSKRILLVLHDVWEKLVVEEFGIPRGCKDCTILLTSRNRDVLRAMNVEKVYGMKVLTKEDTWFLLRETAGTCVDDIGLNSVAKEVVEECGGLPIALKTVGLALKDENDKDIWKDVVTQLRKASPYNIPDFLKEVYYPLKVSYDKLDSQKAKSVFLLCCLFGEDVDIPLEYLTYFCMGLGIFEGGNNNLEQARNRMSALIKMLKSRSLLLDGRNEDYIQMHDVLRDVCIFIAREKGYIGGSDCTWISSFLMTVGQRTKLPTNLGLLFFSGSYSELEEEINKFDNSFVESIRDLQVLFIENYSSLTSLHTLDSLRNLRTLVLDSCSELETISGIGELVNLEILVCRRCDLIKELPLEMKRLNRLKLLDLSWCENLERIGRGIIRSLFGLEELKMLKSFKKWEAVRDSNERGDGNATVRELEALTNLRCLEIEIDDPALAAENMRLSSKLERFKIRIASDQDLCQRLEFLPYSFNKTMSLKLEGGTRVGDWIEIQLLRDAECLQLTGNGANNVDYLAKCQNIRWLSLGECETMKNIGRTSVDDATVFPFLEYLELRSLGVLEEILDGPILWNQEEEWRITKTFPKLKEVELYNLPNLATFYQGIGGIEFPLLMTMRMKECPKLKSMVSSKQNNPGGSSNAGTDDDYSSHLFCQPLKVSFGSLEKLFTDQNPFCGHEILESSFKGLDKLEIVGYKGSMSLFTSSIARNFVSLRILSISKCDQMVQVIQDEEEKTVSGGKKTILFPNLQELEFRDLCKLVRFGEWKCDIELPSLSQVIIVKCPMMTNFTSEQRRSAIAQLQILHIEQCEIMEQVFCCKGIESFEFPQLTQIQVKDCPLLMDRVFSMNLFFESDKVKMDMWNNQPFRNAEYLSLEGNACRNLDFRVVQNMRLLTLRECSMGKKLVNVTTMHTLFPHIEVLRLVKLTELEEIWDIDGLNSFQNLRELSLEFLPSLKHLWPSQVVSIFNKLSCIYIYGCHKLCNLFSLRVTETDSYLLQLEELVIESCDMMEYVFFWNEGENQSNIHIPKLKVLILDSLPKLTSFCKGTKKIEFPLLDRKRISRCPLLENFVSTDWPPDDHGHNIHLFCEPDNEKMKPKLQGNITLGRNRIQECVDYMSLDGSTSSDFGLAESMRCLTIREFPMGTRLINMATIATLFRCIKVLTFRDCYMEKKLMNMTTIYTHFPPLEVLCLVNIKDLEEIWDIDGPKNINELRLKSLPALKHLWQSSSSPSQMNAVSIFSKLSSIYIHGCHELCNLFSLPVTDTGSCVLQLENLVIESCEMMEHVFLWNGKESQRSIVFPKLKVLKLDSLLSLTSFCEGMESFEFPLLVEMRISGCPLLRNLVFTESPTDDDDGKSDKKKIELWMNQLFRKVTYLSLEGDNYRNLDLKLADQNMLSFKELSTEMKLLNVTTIDTLFPRLEILKLVELTELVEIWEFDGPIRSTSFKNLKELKLEFLKRPKHLWLSTNSPYQMTVVSIFNQLSSIYIYGCDGLCNLFSLSMMPRGSCLSQLERLQIESCKNMEQVFLWNEEKNIHVQEFPKLKFVSLSFLPKLRNICKGVKRIQCPHLDKMKIVNCPKLESLVYWHKDRSPFIFNSSRYALERGTGANTALQPHMLRREEQQQQQQQKEVEEEQRKKITEGGRRCEIEEEPDS